MEEIEINVFKYCRCCFLEKAFKKNEDYCFYCFCFSKYVIFEGCDVSKWTKPFEEFDVSKVLPILKEEEFEKDDFEAPEEPI